MNKIDLCDVCAAEGYPYNEETCKDCPYKVPQERKTTTFKPIATDTRGYACQFSCNVCGCTVSRSYYMKPDLFDYNYCPYCGRPVESEDAE